MPRDRFHAASVDANLVVREVGLVPSSVTVRPLRLTRPWRISSSAARREAIPAAESSFCNRSTALSSPPRWRRQRMLSSLSVSHRLVVAAILALGTGVLASPIPAAAQDTREEVIAAAQAEKEKTPPPATQSGAEHIAELVGGVLTPKAHSFFPYFDSVYSGGGFTLGAGYGWLYGDHSNAAIRGLYSIKNYKLIEAVTLRRSISTAS